MEVGCMMMEPSLPLLIVWILELLVTLRFWLDTTWVPESSTMGGKSFVHAWKKTRFRIQWKFCKLETQWERRSAHISEGVHIIIHVRIHVLECNNCLWERKGVLVSFLMGVLERGSTIIIRLGWKELSVILFKENPRVQIRVNFIWKCISSANLKWTLSLENEFSILLHPHLPSQQSGMCPVSLRAPHSASHDNVHTQSKPQGYVEHL